MKPFRTLTLIIPLILTACGGTETENSLVSGSGMKCWDCSSGSCIETGENSPAATLCTETAGYAAQGYAGNASDNSNTSDKSPPCQIAHMSSAGCAPCVYMEPSIHEALTYAEKNYLVEITEYIKDDPEHGTLPPGFKPVVDALPGGVINFPTVIGLPPGGVRFRADGSNPTAGTEADKDIWITIGKDEHLGSRINPPQRPFKYYYGPALDAWLHEHCTPRKVAVDNGSWDSDSSKR